MLTRFYGVVLAMLCTASLSAQGPPPAISPWLSMFNNNRGGALSNYHTFVQPQQRAIQAIQTQGQQIHQLQSQAQQFQASGGPQRSLRDGGRVLAAPRQVGSIGGMRGAGFRQYLHYYQGLPQGGVPSYARPGRR